MVRKSIFAVAATCLIFNSALAVEITSDPYTIRDVGDFFLFDFTGDPDLSAINEHSTLTQIMADWTFTPGAGQSGISALEADLFVGGANAGVGFEIALDLAVASSTAVSGTIAPKLSFGAAVLGDLLANPNGSLLGELNLSGSSVAALDDFFAAGGELEGIIALRTNENAPPDPGGSGDPVPEPASLLVWGALGLGLIAGRRYRRLRAG